MYSKIKAVIFDMDGVLTDSEGAITKASVEALYNFGVNAKEEDFKEFTGMGDDKFIGGVSEKYGIKYDLSMKAKAYEIYIKNAYEEVKVFPESKKTIETLCLLNRTEKGCPIAVASSSDKLKVEANIKCIGVDTDCFNIIITGSDVARKKPFPDIYLKTAEMLKTAPENCLVIEDALSGVTAAKAAGMKCAAVTTSFSADKLKEKGADIILKNLFDIIKIVYPDY
jgi:HAD superfamily hydrolase (TIGR01549 family)